ncbi:MAG: ROK family transcriptional regulator [Bifidobacteriaceae bacterium]|jgi:predicted NBD/HSP70 family sugar kinase|nr:ROK family transcriptional regulator [Bifidobacteriaceae bacterium]
MNTAVSGSKPSDLLPASILGLLGARGPLTRAELASALRVSPASITQASKALMAKGMVLELGQLASGGGRPARPLSLVGAAGRIVGAKVTASHLAVVGAKLDGEVTLTRKVPFDVARADALDVAARALQDVLAEVDGPVLGVGIAVPGSVDSVGSGVADSPTIGWRNARVGTVLRQRLGVPVLVENDVNALAVAEQVYGVGTRYSTYLVVTIGRGIGCGIVIGGEVFRGAGGGAGEIGHLPVAEDGPPCPYGHRGCLESLIGSAGLVRRAGELGLVDGARVEGPDAELEAIRALGDKAERDPALAEGLFGWAGRLLGSAVAGAVNLLNPETIVLLGEGTAQWALWEPGFTEAFRSKLIESRRSVPFLVDPWDEDKWALGAAALVIASSFDKDGAAGYQGGLVRERLGAAASGRRGA